MDTGRLRASPSNVYRLTDMSLVMGTNLGYARKLQEGGTVRIPARTIKPKKAKALHFWIGGTEIFVKSVQQPARTVTIPPRPFILFQEQDKDQIRNLIMQYIEKAIRAS